MEQACGFAFPPRPALPSRSIVAVSSLCNTRITDTIRPAPPVLHAAALTAHSCREAAPLPGVYWISSCKRPRQRPCKPFKPLANKEENTRGLGERHIFIPNTGKHSDWVICLRLCCTTVLWLFLGSCQTEQLPFHVPG